MKKYLTLFISVLCLMLFPLQALAEEELSADIASPEPVIEADESPDENGAAQAGSVEISTANFPDENFRACVAAYADPDGDGWLTSDEIADVTDLIVYFEDISSLEGIGIFTELEFLACSYNEITSLDLSGNTKLSWLYCEGNPLTVLDIRPCPLLCAIVENGTPETKYTVVHWPHTDGETDGILYDEGVTLITPASELEAARILQASVGLRENTDGFTPADAAGILAALQR